MTIATWCLLAAGLLPYAATVIAKAGARFDNAEPREWLARQEGYRRRANAAQLNSFEAFPLFAAAVLVAQQGGAPQGRTDALAVAFVAARVLYLACYVAGWTPARSVCWLGGLGCAVAIWLGAP